MCVHLSDQAVRKLRQNANLGISERERRKLRSCRRHVVAVVLTGAEEFAAGGYRIAAALEDHALSAHIVDHAVLDPCVFDVFVKPAVEHEAAVALCNGAAAYQNVFQLVLLGIVKEAVCSAAYRADEYCLAPSAAPGTVFPAPSLPESI